MNTLFTETNSSWLTYRSIKALAIKTLIAFNLVFGKNAILSCFSLCIIDLYFLILVIIAQFFNPTVEFAIPREAPTNEANAEIETQSLTAKTKTRKCSK